MTITGKTSGGSKGEKKMSKLNKKIAIILFAIFASTISFAITGFATKAKADTEAATCPTSGVFEIKDKVGLKLNEDGGMRWILKIDQAYFNYINNNSAVEVGFIIAPKFLMDKANGDYYGMQQKIVVEVNKKKIYELTDKDGYHYANGCVINMKEVNRKYDYTAAAYIKNGETIEKQSAVNENSVKSFYDVSNAAILYSGEDYSEKMLGLGAYEWLGTEAYPITVSDSEQYNTLKKRQGNSYYKGKHYVVSTDVEYNAGDVSEIGSNVSRYGVETAPAAKGGLIYTGSAQELVKAGTAAGENCKIMYKIEGGEWGESVPVSTNAGEYRVYYKAVKDNLETIEKTLTVNIAKADNEITYDKDAKGEIIGLDFVYGNKPNETTAKAIAGEITYTYTLVSEDSNADVRNVTVPDGAKYLPWNDNNKPGLYKCLITAAESDNYKSIVADRWVRFHKKEIDEKGVKYTYNASEDAYAVSGYAGSGTEVNVLDTFNDGANGEKDVTLIAQNCAWGSVVKKIILPNSVFDFKGNSFQSALNLEYISMTGVTHISTINNFIDNQKITTVIVNKAFNLDNQQFKMHEKTADPTVVIYVDGSKNESTFAFKNAGNEFLTGIVYYKVADNRAPECLEWRFDEKGNLLRGLGEHNFVDGKCTICGEYNTAGVLYGYDKVSKSYYVTGCESSLTEVIVLDKFDDGEHGEQAVTFIKFGAFQDNATIKKVVLPETITELDGCAFLSCSNLEYVDMRGVAELKKTTLVDLKNADKRSNETYPGNDHTWRNFEGCINLKTVIVGKTFKVDARMFHSDSVSNVVKIYTTAANKSAFTLTIDRTTNSGNNNLLSDSVYYFSETKLSGAWHYDKNGVAVLWA